LGYEKTDARHAEVQVIGLDLGGTKLHAGTTTANGRQGRQIFEPTQTGSEAELFEQLLDAVLRLRDDRPRAVVALGAPGAITQPHGALDLVPNLPLTGGRPLGRDLEQALGLPVSIENDVNLAALAEARLGAGTNLDLVCFLSFGTGVGMGTVVGGRILRGAHGRAGEISYLPIGTPSATAKLTAAGQFEDLVGKHALTRRYSGMIQDGQALFEKAYQGDAEAIRAIEETAAHAALGVAGVQSLLDPDLIVIGGGIGMQKLFFERLSHDAARLFPFPINLRPSGLGTGAGLLGAIALGCDRAGLPLDALPRAPSTTTAPASGEIA
jgi:glucokinase